jgi:hypothetical protein
MQDNRDKLYDNLVKSGKVSESEIGTRDQFKSAIKDEASAAKFHDNLLKAGLITRRSEIPNLSIVPSLLISNPPMLLLMFLSMLRVRAKIRRYSGCPMQSFRV